MTNVASLLLEGGADPNGVGPNNGTPPLVLACHHGYHDIVRLFASSALRGKVDFAAKDKSKGENALHRILKGESKSRANPKQRWATF